MQGGNRRGEQGSLNQVDTGEMAGMPKDSKPPSASPEEHHSQRRQGVQRAQPHCACYAASSVQSLMQASVPAKKCVFNAMGSTCSV